MVISKTRAILGKYQRTEENSDIEKKEIIPLEGIVDIESEYQHLVRNDGTSEVVTGIIEREIDLKFEELLGKIVEIRDSFLELAHAYEANKIEPRNSLTYCSIDFCKGNYRFTIDGLQRNLKYHQDTYLGTLLKTEALIKDGIEYKVPEKKSYLTFSNTIDNVLEWISNKKTNLQTTHGKYSEIIRDHKESSENNNIYIFQLNNLRFVIPDLSIRDCTEIVFFYTDRTEMDTYYSQKSIREFASKLSYENKEAFLEESKFIGTCFKDAYNYLHSELKKRKEEQTARLEKIANLQYEDFSELGK